MTSSSIPQPYNDDFDNHGGGPSYQFLDSKTHPPPNKYYPHMFQPLSLGPNIQPLPNRVIMGSMHCGLEGHSYPAFVPKLLGVIDKHGDSLDDLAEYFAERARGGAGLMVTGGIAPNRAGWVAPFSSTLMNQRDMEKHRVVTHAVHTARDNVTGVVGASMICLQILHAGRYGMHPLIVSPSGTKSPITAFTPRQMTTSDVKSTIHDFVNCAILAKEAGYDGVEIMGSEGYLLNQFLVKHTNQRTDEYGGTYENRMKFPLEIVSETRRAVGDDFIVMFRLSMLDLIEDGSSWEEVVTLAQALEDVGVTILNTGIGWHEARIPTISTNVPRGAFTWVTQKLRGAVSVPLCTTNRINAPHVIERSLETGFADLVSMARPFLADPDIINKSRLGQHEYINTCIGCNQACLDHAFVGKTASCLVNPRACHEKELEIVPLSITRPKRIAVVGAGPAGLAFATTAAELGHNVVLFDSAGEIGGQFNMAKQIPGKEEFHETIRYFRNKIDTLKDRLEVRLDVFVTPEMLLQDRGNEEENGFDEYVIATGVVPRIPSMPGINHPKVLSYIDVLRNKVHVGKRVAIIGAGGIGFDVAEYLAHRTQDEQQQQPLSPDEVGVDEFLDYWGIDKSIEIGRGGLLSLKQQNEHNQQALTTEETLEQRSIALLQRKTGKVGASLGKTTGWIHRATLTKAGVEYVAGCTYDKVDDNGNLHVTIKDKKKNTTSKRIFEVDHIISCAGQIKRNDLANALKLQHDVHNCYTIGGAYEAGELDAKRAIDNGTRLAIAIGEKEQGRGQKEQQNNCIEKNDKAANEELNDFVYNHEIKNMGVETKMIQIMKRFF
eukprot:CAMPEP_0194373742 /NCGR_PEP_ID=MMETSP0174-20130528/22202_1 /TAXON_ID=216777 /ORGANISM="Proboscia alata, Strain PI-D3" /LENGTH=831 /DNA_ID=CAMNT_0039152997 /DNA_START=444 /DNA_END=2939 /DNA_ORIENTATION=+